METNEKKGRKPTPPDATEVNAEPKTGPLGRTRSEEQRRRLIITGLATPGLMTLPSRRVWASKCTKSKLLSGNLSPGKKKPDCGLLGCKTGDWKNPDMHVIGGENWTGTSFNNALDPGGMVFSNSYTLLNALEKDMKPGEWNGTKNLYHEEGKLNDCAKEAAAAYLNSVYISWPPPNDVFNFTLSATEISTLWGNAVTASLGNDKTSLEVIKKQLKDANEKDTSCPFR